LEEEGSPLLAFCCLCICLIPPSPEMTSTLEQGQCQGPQGATVMPTLKNILRLQVEDLPLNPGVSSASRWE
jgi:hypothetical protein